MLSGGELVAGVVCSAQYQGAVMSAIIINLSSDFAHITTDTLVVGGDPVGPVGFTMKAKPWHRMKIIVAGTGLFGFADFWLSWADEHLKDVTDIEDVDLTMTATLSEMYKGSGASTTIYLFGVGSDMQMKGFSYSSDLAFISKPISYGQSVKPTAGPEPDPSSYRDLVQVMQDQRAIQERLPPSDRLHIGGEIHVLTLDTDGVFTHEVAHQFEDYPDLIRGIPAEMI
jgi:hypothetical protein